MDRKPGLSPGAARRDKMNPAVQPQRPGLSPPLLKNVSTCCPVPLTLPSPVMETLQAWGQEPRLPSHPGLAGLCCGTLGEPCSSLGSAWSRTEASSCFANEHHLYNPTVGSSWYHPTVGLSAPCSDLKQPFLFLPLWIPLGFSFLTGTYFAWLHT